MEDSEENGLMNDRVEEVEESHFTGKIKTVF